MAKEHDESFRKKESMVASLKVELQVKMKEKMVLLLSKGLLSQATVAALMHTQLSMSIFEVS